MTVIATLCLLLLVFLDAKIRQLAGDPLPGHVNPMRWMIFPWVLSLLLLALPIVEHIDRFEIYHALYLLACFFGLCVGAWFSVFTRKPLALQPSGQSSSGVKLLWFFAFLGFLGIVSQVFDQIHVSGFSLGERLGAADGLETARKLRNEAALDQEYGPLSKFERLSAFIYIHICSFPLLTADKSRSRTVHLLVAGFLAALVVFNSVFVSAGRIQIAILALVLLTSGVLDQKRTLFNLVLGNTKAKRWTRLAILGILGVAVLVFFSTFFMERRLGRLAPMVVINVVHRANVAEWLMPYFIAYPKLQYGVMSLSYFTVPIPTLVYYLNLPESIFPGPYLGQLHIFKPFLIISALFNVKLVQFWQAEIDTALAAAGYGINVWPTILREFAFEVTRPGVPFLMAVLGFVMDRVVRGAYYLRDPWLMSIAAALLATAAWSSCHTLLKIDSVFWMLAFSTMALVVRKLYRWTAYRPKPAKLAEVR